MEHFAQYNHAIFALGAFVLIVMILNPLSANIKTNEGVESGAMPPADYSSKSYRWSRAYMNAMEVSGPFVGATVAAILAGGSPLWVNLLASVFLVSRLIMAYVHIKGIGHKNMGPRTMIFALGMFCICGLALIAMIGALT
ncbi:hypothetical protein GCM10007939_10600 [Amylibacter marinus]|uniref:MAPEG family protein n=1 Tax=Amylibacter marinus TaxID=1475483 RepID=A0ABQ5VU47_9RHOB|nr:MAPEG family protein [Amylibacter marinus]GLQ34777.1 hypothetical protein GCM10007939_10600 [Amylibacter marinus]